MILVLGPCRSALLPPPLPLPSPLCPTPGALEDGVHPIVTIPETALKQLEFTYIQEELQITLFFFKSLLR